MNLSERVARRFIASKLEFFEDEVVGAVDTLKNLHSYGKTMGQALAILRPVTECLRSKPLAKIYVDLKETLGVLPHLVDEVNAIKSGFEQLDATCALEAARVRNSAEPVSIPDIQVPRNELRNLQKRIRAHNARVEKTFDEASFSTDDIGNAGSTDLRTYERLIEQAISWEEMTFPEEVLNLDVGGVAELIYDAAKA